MTLTLSFETVYFETDRVGLLGQICTAIASVGDDILQANIQPHCNRFVIRCPDRSWSVMETLKGKLKEIEGVTRVDFMLNPEDPAVMQK